MGQYYKINGRTVFVNSFEDELAAGIKIEMEHTDDKAVADKIARDHLEEDSQYYTKLKGAGL